MCGLLPVEEWFYFEKTEQEDAGQTQLKSLTDFLDNTGGQSSADILQKRGF